MHPCIHAWRHQTVIHSWIHASLRPCAHVYLRHAVLSWRIHAFMPPQSCLHAVTHFLLPSCKHVCMYRFTDSCITRASIHPSIHESMHPCIHTSHQSYSHACSSFFSFSPPRGQQQSSVLNLANMKRASSAPFPQGQKQNKRLPHQEPSRTERSSRQPGRQVTAS